MRLSALAVSSVTALLTIIAMPSFAADTVTMGGPWQGLYGGLELGGDFGEAHRDWGPEHTTTGSMGVDGVIGGITGGYNMQVGNVILGLEADFSGSGASGTHSCPEVTYSCDVYSNWLGTVRPRLGYAIGPLLPYATAGYAVGDVHSYSHNYATGATGSQFDDSESGYAAGGGVEYAIANSPFSVKAEYLYVNLDDAHGPGGAGESTVVKFHQNIGRIGLNYKFN